MPPAEQVSSPKPITVEQALEREWAAAGRTDNVLVEGDVDAKWAKEARDEQDTDALRDLISLTAMQSAGDVECRESLCRVSMRPDAQPQDAMVLSYALRSPFLATPGEGDKSSQTVYFAKAVIHRGGEVAGDIPRADWTGEALQ